jgi:hypothetical protein
MAEEYKHPKHKSLMDAIHARDKEAEDEFEAAAKAGKQIRLT